VPRGYNYYVDNLPVLCVYHKDANPVTSDLPSSTPTSC
jgi:hypothetical protein